LTQPVGILRYIEEALFYSPWPALPALSARDSVTPKPASGRGDAHREAFSFFGFGLHFYADRVTPSGVKGKCGGCNRIKDANEFPAQEFELSSDLLRIRELRAPSHAFRE